jgi:hypothetical protein
MGMRARKEKRVKGAKCENCAKPLAPRVFCGWPVVGGNICTDCIKKVLSGDTVCEICGKVVIGGGLCTACFPPDPAAGKGLGDDDVFF